jgi:riboflavin synthase
MFTGLIEGIGRVKTATRIRADMRVTIAPPFDAAECRLGDSICVNGVCITVTDIRDGAFSADVSGETLARSTMVDLRPGVEVNLERALRLSDRLGGHLVAGHVDGVGKILSFQQEQRYWLLRVAIHEALARYTIEKGSIAVDGISLTINRCEKASFEISIIPQTAGETTLTKKKVGDSVNIEVDMIGKYVEKLLAGGSRHDHQSTPINREMLAKFGFREQQP